MRAHWIKPPQNSMPSRQILKSLTQKRTDGGSFPCRLDLDEQRRPQNQVSLRSCAIFCSEEKRYIRKKGVSPSLNPLLPQCDATVFDGAARLLSSERIFGMPHQQGHALKPCLPLQPSSAMCFGHASGNCLHHLHALGYCRGGIGDHHRNRIAGAIGCGHDPDVIIARRPSASVFGPGAGLVPEAPARLARRPSTGRCGPLVTRSSKESIMTGWRQATTGRRAPTATARGATPSGVAPSIGVRRDNDRAHPWFAVFRAAVWRVPPRTIGCPAKRIASCSQRQACDVALHSTARQGQSGCRSQILFSDKVRRTASGPPIRCGDRLVIGGIVAFR
jgi:hypothetical protein